MQEKTSRLNFTNLKVLGSGIRLVRHVLCHEGNRNIQALEWGHQELLGPCVTTGCFSVDRTLSWKSAFINYAAQGFQWAKGNYWPKDNIGITLVPPQSTASPQTTVPSLASDIIWGWNEGQKMLGITFWEKDWRKDHFPFKFQLEVLKSEAQNYCEQLCFLKTHVSLFHIFWWYEWDRIPNTTCHFFIQSMIFSPSCDHLFRNFQSAWAVISLPELHFFSHL